MLQDNVQLETRRVHFGREDILERIEQCFKKSKIVCLLGVPGIGKASTAIEYGKKSKSKRSLIIRFFNCDSEDKLLSEFQGLACELKIGNEIREKRILINICYQKLANLPNEFLFIFQNLKEIDFIQPFMSNASSNVRFILTTCNKNLLIKNEEIEELENNDEKKDPELQQQQQQQQQNHEKHDSNSFTHLIEPIEMSYMTKKELREFINKSINQRIKEKTKEYEELFKLLANSNSVSPDLQESTKTLNNNEEYLPLKIQKVIAYLVYNKTIDTRTLLDKLKENNNQEILLLVESIQDEKMLNVLHHMCFLDGDFISLDIVKRIANQPDESWLTDLTNRFGRLFLIERVQKRGLSGLQMHKSIQEDIKQSLQNDEKDLEMNILINLLACFDSLIDVVLLKEDEDWTRNYVEMAHIKLLLNLIHEKYIQQINSHETLSLIVSLLVKQGRFYQNQLKELDKAKENYFLANEILLRSKKENFQQLIFIICKQLGFVYQELGEYKTALDYYETCLKMGNDIFNVNHPALAVILDNIGHVQQQLGDLTSALENYEKSLKMKEHLYGTRNESIANSYSYIGSIYKNINKFDLAYEYHLKALLLKQEIFKQNNLSIAETFDNIGQLYSVKSNSKKAIEFYEKSIKIKEFLSNTNTASIAQTLNKIGYEYHKIGNTEMAIGHFNRALKIMHKLYDGIHPHIADTFYNIGLLFKGLDKNKKALEYFNKCLQIEIVLYNKNHPTVARTLNKMALSFKDEGEYEKSLEFFEKALKIRLNCYNKNHPEVAENYYNIGSLYKKIGNEKLALENFEDSLKIREKLFNAYHPEVANSLYAIGDVHRSNQNLDSALHYYKKCLKLQNEAYEKNHLDIAETLKAIGLVNKSMGNSSASVKYLEKSVKIRQELYKKIKN
jgi:tetratricopeptide (TPR) repeat protein